MPAPLDLAVAAVIGVLWPAIEHFVFWARDRRRLDSGDPAARRGLYQRTFAVEWGLSAAAAFAWLTQGHPWRALPLYAPEPWRLALGMVVVLVVVALMTQQVSVVRRSAKARASVRRQIAPVARVLPGTTLERGWFMALSVTAGVCEEWLFRGVLTTLFAMWFGLPLAVLLANVSFGFGHAYQGRKQILTTGVIGLAMSGIVLATGSLVPAMLVHAVVDIGSGLTGYFALTLPDEAEPAAAPPSAGAA